MIYTRRIYRRSCARGFLAFCVLKVCQTARYTNEIIAALDSAQLVVVEGTIYLLLGRLQKDGLLEYHWRESEQGPPRKYYTTSEFGQQVMKKLEKISRRSMPR